VTGARCHGEAITAGGRSCGADDGICDDVTADVSRPVTIVVVYGIYGREVTITIRRGVERVARTGRRRQQRRCGGEQEKVGQQQGEDVGQER